MDEVWALTAVAICLLALYRALSTLTVYPPTWLWGYFRVQVVDGATRSGDFVKYEEIRDQYPHKRRQTVWCIFFSNKIKRVAPGLV